MGAVEHLKRYCEEHDVQRFSADEILELLEEGETVDWIVSQVLPDAVADTELRTVLEVISAAVAPADKGGGEECVKFASVQETADESLLEELDETPAAAPDLADLQGMLPKGVDMAQLEQLLSSPRGELMADFGLFCQEREVDTSGSNEMMQEVMRELQKEWLTTPREALGGKRPQELLNDEELFPSKVETMRRETPKIGRNDPCPCGSGKKYKKCCGRGSS